MIKQFAISLWLTSISAIAQDTNHLLPENSVYAIPSLATYYFKVGQTFNDVFSFDAAKVVVLPSFGYEYVVGIEGGGEGCSLVHAETTVRLSGYEIIDQPSDDESLDDPLDAPLKIFSQSIAPELCNQINEIWQTILLDTRYAVPNESDGISLGGDGTSYHFSTWVMGTGVLSGQTHSPAQTTLSGKLVELSHSMSSYARSGASNDLAELEQAVLQWKK
ncbi:MAG: hypothetical protein V4628_05255 [Pseudomonadota bacterium]